MAKCDSTGPAPDLLKLLDQVEALVNAMKRGEALAVLAKAKALAASRAASLDDLLAQRIDALSAMRRAGDDFAAFSAASKREAFLSAQIRQLRRAGGGQ